MEKYLVMSSTALMFNIIMCQSLSYASTSIGKLENSSAGVLTVHDIATGSYVTLATSDQSIFKDVHNSSTYDPSYEESSLSPEDMASLLEEINRMLIDGYEYLEETEKGAKTFVTAIKIINPIGMLIVTFVGTIGNILIIITLARRDMSPQHLTMIVLAGEVYFL